MSVVVITGAAGLVGSAAARHFAQRGMDVVGVDNGMRETFFGVDGSVRGNIAALQSHLGNRYTHHDLDVRDRPGLRRLFTRHGSDVTVVVHAAAQPSHNWAATDPFTDFDINAAGTLNVLEQVRRHCPEAVLLHCGSSTVYGDRVNGLPFREQPTRWDLPSDHEYYQGVPEGMPIDQTKHTLFGTSKLAADLLVQEYGRYFGMRTTVLRTGQVCGPALAATRQHGMPAFIVRSAMERRPYSILGYGGKQVRDALHPSDLLAAFDALVRDPKLGAVYNLGGGRENSCSILELIALTEQIVGQEMSVSIAAGQRDGDRKWWITDGRRFAADHPEWHVSRSLRSILSEIYTANLERWTA